MACLRRSLFSSCMINEWTQFVNPYLRQPPATDAGFREAMSITEAFVVSAREQPGASR
jgi:hypothetical protein